MWTSQSHGQECRARAGADGSRGLDGRDWSRERSELCETAQHRPGFWGLLHDEASGARAGRGRGPRTCAAEAGKANGVPPAAAWQEANPQVLVVLFEGGCVQAVGGSGV